MGKGKSSCPKAPQRKTGGVVRHRSVSAGQSERFARLDARIENGTLSNNGRLPGIHGTGWKGSLC